MSRQFLVVQVCETATAHEHPIMVAQAHTIRRAPWPSSASVG